MKFLYRLIILFVLVVMSLNITSCSNVNTTDAPEKEVHIYNTSKSENDNSKKTKAEDIKDDSKFFKDLSPDKQSELVFKESELIRDAETKELFIRCQKCVLNNTTTKKQIHIKGAFDFPIKPYSVFDDTSLHIKWSKDNHYLYLLNKIIDCETGNIVKVLPEHIFFYWLDEHRAVYIIEPTTICYQAKDVFWDEIYFGKKIAVFDVKDNTLNNILPSSKEYNIMHINCIDSNLIIYEEVLFDKIVYDSTNFKDLAADRRADKRENYIKDRKTIMYDINKNEGSTVQNLNINQNNYTSIWVYGEWFKDYVLLGEKKIKIFPLNLLS